MASTDPIRERDVEAYLVKRVKALGGEVRKVQWIGRRGAPDRFVMLPFVIFWAEIKRPGGKLEPHQEREIARMRGFGETVYVLDSFGAVDWALTGADRALSAFVR